MALLLMPAAAIKTPIVERTNSTSEQNVTRFYTITTDESTSDNENVASIKPSAPSNQSAKGSTKGVPITQTTPKNKSTTTVKEEETQTESSIQTCPGVTTTTSGSNSSCPKRLEREFYAAIGLTVFILVCNIVVCILYQLKPRFFCMKSKRKKALRRNIPKVIMSKASVKGPVKGEGEKPSLKLGKKEKKRVVEELTVPMRHYSVTSSIPKYI